MRNVSALSGVNSQKHFIKIPIFIHQTPPTKPINTLKFLGLEGRVGFSSFPMRLEIAKDKKTWNKNLKLTAFEIQREDALALCGTQQHPVRETSSIMKIPNDAQPPPGQNLLKTVWPVSRALLHAPQSMLVGHLHCEHKAETNNIHHGRQTSELSQTLETLEHQTVEGRNEF